MKSTACASFKAGTTLPDDDGTQIPQLEETECTDETS